jgi:hypothetical protein
VGVHCRDHGHQTVWKRIERIGGLNGQIAFLVVYRLNLLDPFNPPTLLILSLARARRARISSSGAV